MNACHFMFDEYLAFFNTNCLAAGSRTSFEFESDVCTSTPHQTTAAGKHHVNVSSESHECQMSRQTKLIASACRRIESRRFVFQSATPSGASTVIIGCTHIFSPTNITARHKEHGIGTCQSAMWDHGSKARASSNPNSYVQEWQGNGC